MSTVRRLIRGCLGSPLRIVATAAAITPGMHLLLSRAVERRRPTWATEYPAVLVGDPLLALSAGIAAEVAGVDAVFKSVPLRREVAPVIAGAAALFGAWQVHDEVRRGVYSKQQACSPTKLWHQFVVYPTLCPLVGGAVLAATKAAAAPDATRRQRLGAAVAWGGVAVWGVLVVDAVRRPKQGHGVFDWNRLTRRRGRAAG